MGQVIYTLSSINTISHPHGEQLLLFIAVSGSTLANFAQPLKRKFILRNRCKNCFRFVGCPSNICTSVLSVILPKDKSLLICIVFPHLETLFPIYRFIRDIVYPFTFRAHALFRRKKRRYSVVKLFSTFALHRHILVLKRQIVVFDGFQLNKLFVRRIICFNRRFLYFVHYKKLYAFGEYLCNCPLVALFILILAVLELSDNAYLVAFMYIFANALGKRAPGYTTEEIRFFFAVLSLQALSARSDFL